MPCRLGVQGEPSPGAPRVGALGEPPEAQLTHQAAEALIDDI